MEKKVIRFSPTLLPKIGLYNGKYKIIGQSLLQFPGESYEDLGRKEANITKKNIGRLFVEMYAALYGGEVNPDFRETYDYHPNGNRRFMPDITKILKNERIDTEVKAMSTIGGKVFIGLNQIENYCHNYFDNLKDHGQAQVDYAVFRYGKRLSSLKDPVKLSTLSNNEMKKAIANTFGHKIRDMLIIPLNLLLFLLNHPSYDYMPMNHESSTSSLKNPNYYLFKSGDISRLHHGMHGLEHFIESSHTNEDAGKFMLRDIEVSQSLSPQRFYIGRHKISQFPITRYSLDESSLKRWADYFSENHESILRGIGIRDLHKEKKDHRAFLEEDEDIFDYSIGDLMLSKQPRYQTEDSILDSQVPF